MVPTLTKSCDSGRIIPDKEINRSLLCRSLPLVFSLLFLGRHWVREKSRCSLWCLAQNFHCWNKRVCCGSCLSRNCTWAKAGGRLSLFWYNSLPLRKNAGSFLLICLWELTSLSNQGHVFVFSLHRWNAGAKYILFSFQILLAFYLYSLNQLEGQSRML